PRSRGDPRNQQQSMARTAGSIVPCEWQSRSYPSLLPTPLPANSTMRFYAFRRRKFQLHHFEFGAHACLLGTGVAPGGVLPRVGNAASTAGNSTRNTAPPVCEL